MLKIKEKQKVFFIVGAGGTGSWLASFLSKTDNEIVLIDGDSVESKNVLRQNFTQNDVTQMKAECLGDRYDFAYSTEYIKDTNSLKDLLSNFEGYLPVIVGCLDNNASRKIIHDLFEELDDIIWIDSGNAERHGQTYIAVKDEGEIKYPSPLEIDEVFKNFEGDERRPDQISCAEHSESAPQNITANITAATILFDIICIVANSGILLSNKIEWDTRTMSFTKVNSERI